MKPIIKIPNRKPGRFKVGDRVRILHGFRGMIGDVIEDRGPLGTNGRRIYTVKFQMDEWNDHVSEYPEDSLEPVTASAVNGQPKQKN